MKGIKQVWSFVALAFVAFLVVAYKAFTLSIVHDEGITIEWYLPLSYLDIALNNIEGVLPNNHILNTLLAKLSSRLFGEHEFVYRLPNVLSFILFAFSLFRLSKNIKQPLLKLALWTTLLFGPYLLDFYSLCRGYGLSIAFMLTSVVNLLEFNNTQKEKSLHLTLAFGLLAMLSNFSLSYFLMPIFLFLLYTSAVTKNWRIFRITSFWALFIILVTAKPLSEIVSNNSLFGPTDSFWSSTYGSLVVAWLYIVHKPVQYYYGYIQWALFIPMFVMTITSLKAAFAEQFRRFTNQQILVAIPFISIIIQLTGTHMLGHHLLTYRVALFLAPLAIIALIFSADNIVTHAKIKASIGIIICVGSMSLFVSKVNLNSVYEWFYDSHSKEVFYSINKHVKQNQPLKEKAKIGISWVFEPSLNYYINKHGNNLYYPVHRWGFDGFKEDFYYVIRDDYSDSLKLNTEVICYFEDTQTFLLKNTQNRVDQIPI
jgi:MFS family permease